VRAPIRNFQDAMLEKNPIWSGLMPKEQFLVDAARKERLAGLYGPQQAEIQELEQTIGEALRRKTRQLPTRTHAPSGRHGTSKLWRWTGIWQLRTVS
jgi:hypothetical protein